MVAGEGRGGRGEGMDWEFGISRCKLLYIEWIKNKVLLYSTGNCTQYFVITCKGKEPEKEYLSIYISICPSIYLNHCAVHIKLTQHCKSTILQIKKLMKKSGRVFLLIGSHGLLITMTTWLSCYTRVSSEWKPCPVLLIKAVRLQSLELSHAQPQRGCCFRLCSVLLHDLFV